MCREQASKRYQRDSKKFVSERLSATIDSGQFIVTRSVSDFLQRNPKVTAELAFTNRPLRMIEEAATLEL